MKRLLLVVLAILTYNFFPSPSVRADPPSSGMPAGSTAAEIIKWQAQSILGDGRKFVTDGAMVLDSRYIGSEAIPEKAVPAQSIQRLLESPTDREFATADIQRIESNGHFLAMDSIQLNRKYIEYLLRAALNAPVKFRASGPDDAVLILDGEAVIGVVMPMKAKG